MRNRAQSIMEYTVLIAILALALVAMQAYLKRGVQGRLRTQADELGGGALYSPRATTATSSVTRDINETMTSYSVVDSAADKTKKNITESKSTITQKTTHDEELVPLKDEPKRE